MCVCAFNDTNGCTHESFQRHRVVGFFCISYPNSKMAVLVVTLVFVEMSSATEYEVCEILNKSFWVLTHLFRGSVNGGVVPLSRVGSPVNT